MAEMLQLRDNAGELKLLSATGAGLNLSAPYEARIHQVGFARRGVPEAKFYPETAPSQSSRAPPSSFKVKDFKSILGVLPVLVVKNYT